MRKIANQACDLVKCAINFKDFREKSGFHQILWLWIISPLKSGLDLIPSHLNWSCYAI